MVDATRGFEGQDQKIFTLIERNKKGIVIVVNKWDLIEKDHTSTRKFEEQIRNEIAPFNDVPIVFTSVINKQRIHKVLELAHQVYENRKRKISTSQLNDYLLPIIENNPPPSNKGKYIKIKYITQLPTVTPEFVFFCNLPQYVKEPYKRFVENKIRKNWDFTGATVKIHFRKK